jgi:hypothetical protein
MLGTAPPLMLVSPSVCEQGFQAMRTDCSLLGHVIVWHEACQADVADLCNAVLRQQDCTQVVNVRPSLQWGSSFCGLLA